jgi:hypothetical protein
MTVLKLTVCFFIALAISGHSNWEAVVFLVAVLIFHLFRPVIRWIFIGLLFGEGLKLSGLRHKVLPVKRRRARIDPNDDFPENLNG